MGIRTLLAAAALATTVVGAAAPALAQGYGYEGYGYAPASYGYGGPSAGWGDPARALRDREDRIGGWIRSARDGGRIGGWQADRAFGDLQRVRDDERRARWSQGARLYGDQVARLNDRLSLIADRLRLDRDRDAGPRW